MMADLVQIPWQPYLWLTPSTFALLKEASRLRGHNIMLNGQDAAWRSYERQDYLWDINGHNPAKANDPERGQRSHMRGAAIDGPTDARTRQAFKDAGLLPDPNEPWHWNDPHWPFMPIIRTNTAAAGGDSAAIKGVLMSLSDVEQAEVLETVRNLKTQVNRIADALFKTAPIAASTTGGNPIPGGVLRMESISYDGLTQRKGVNGATRDGTLVALEKITEHLGIE